MEDRIYLCMERVIVVGQGVVGRVVRVCVWVCVGVFVLMMVLLYCFVETSAKLFVQDLLISSYFCTFIV